jgi:membrane protein implicated in regulation of membrane protease activity
MANRFPEQRQRTSRAWYLLLLLPFIGLLWPPLYARVEPRLWGFPFFYWYQFVWVPVAAVLTAIVYRMTTRREGGDR